MGGRINNQKPIFTNVIVTLAKYVAAVTVLYLTLQGLVTASEIAPPKYNLVDRMGVNMATGQVQVSQTDLSIGGAMGLTHTTSQHSSDFFGGFNSNYFRGSAGRRYFLAGGDISSQFSIVRVFGGGTTVDFTYSGSNGSYKYAARNDPRNELAFVPGTGLVCTLADGTEMIYAASSFDPNANQQLALTQIVHPNGVRITRNHLLTGAMSSVRTNTGWQLKYQYVDDNRPLDPIKQNSTMADDFPADSLGWSRGNPKHVVALNNSMEHCDVADKFCNTSNSWPTTTYQWPAGMPRAMAVEGSTFSITDPEGRTTHYHHFGIDKAVQIDNMWLNGLLPGNESEPRITSIDQPGNSPIAYQYENRVIQNSSGSGQGLRFPLWFPDGYGVLKGATHDSESMSYTPVAAGPGSDTFNISLGYQAIKKVEHNNQKGVIRFADMAEMLVKREDTFENKIKYIYDKRSDLYKTFDYDNRLNITAIKERDTNPETSANPSFEITTARAQYPVSCNSANRKYCNKAQWMEDANGHRTDYTYHAPSGQVATVTLPPDEDGIRAHTRYTYVQKTATHSGADFSPVWVLDKEEFCRNSAASGTNCSGNDETVTSYQYETENILLIGKAVTASGITLRTCYRYGRLGRQIGETEPNANLNTCSY